MAKIKEHMEYCKGIADELANLASEGSWYEVEGDVVEYECDDNGKEYAVVDGEYFTEMGDELTIDGEEIRTKEGLDSKYGFLGWLGDDCLDVDWVLDSDREYKACRVMIAYGGVMIAYGGPNVYINTYSGKVELYWWNEEGEAWLPSEVCEWIDEGMREWFNC